MKQESGFTLIELLVSITLLAIISLLSYRGLDQILEVESHTERVSEEMRGLQSAIVAIQNDIEQAVNRPIRDRLGDQQGAFEGRPKQIVALSLTVSNRGLAMRDNGESRLQRIDYRLESGTLYRDSWIVLDRAHQSEPLTTPLLNGVESVNWRFYDKNWSDFWPQTKTSTSPLPKGVELTLIHRQAGEIRRLFVTGAG